MLPLALCLAMLFAACEGTTTDTTPTPTLPQAATPPGTPQPTVAAGLDPPRMPEGLEQATVVRVVDGDTIVVRSGGEEHRLRYIGMDTPETVHPQRQVECYGREASERNEQLVGGRQVWLEQDVSDTDRFGRLLRYVWTEDGMVNAILVGEGYATVATFPPDVRYVDVFLSLQQEAREAALGLWGPACTTPVPTTLAEGACEYSGTDEPVIKGNISQRTGERIYHVPGGRFYNVTIIDEDTGERWFCTEGEALEAGWRKSRR